MFMQYINCAAINRTERSEEIGFLKSVEMQSINNKIKSVQKIWACLVFLKFNLLADYYESKLN